MSRVEGCVPSIKRWEFMSLKMAECLRQIADGNLSANQVPNGVLREAQWFFESVVEIVRQNLFGWAPDNPLGDLVNYAFAQQVMGDANDFEGRVWVLRDFLQCLAIARISPEKEFNDSVLRSAASFFQALAELSQNE